MNSGPSCSLPHILIGLACCAIHASGAPSPAVTSAPNVVIITVDQLVADGMSCRMGDTYLKTPAMDSLANNGMVFTRAYCANPLCQPSRNSIFTGRYPHETGVTANTTRHHDPVPFDNLGDYFQRAGYHTAYFGKRHLFFNVDKSFPQAAPEPKFKGHDAQTLADATEFLTQKPAQPFLCVVSFMNPHNVAELSRRQDLPDGAIPPPPGPELCPPAPANLVPQLDEPDTMTVMRKGYQANRLFPVGDFTPDQWRQLRWGYYRLIEKVDSQIGVLLEAIRHAGMEDNTVIVFTSDHGECAGAHGFVQKTVLYEESARVPLIVSLKGRTPAGTCDRLVNTGLDILPTLLEFAGAPVPDALPGMSLRPLALGNPVAQWRDHVVVENDMQQAGSIDGFTPATQGRMIRTEQFKYCVYDRGLRRESLVDLTTDPGEIRNLAGDPSSRAVLLQHRALLARFGKAHNDPLAAELLDDDVKPIPFASSPADEDASKPLKPRIKP